MMKTDLADADGICERFSLTKGTLRQMRDSVGLPETITLDGNEAKYAKHGLEVGVEYYRISDFAALEKKGVLKEFQRRGR